MRIANFDGFARNAGRRPTGTSSIRRADRPIGTASSAILVNGDPGDLGNVNKSAILVNGDPGYGREVPFARRLLLLRIRDLHMIVIQQITCCVVQLRHRQPVVHLGLNDIYFRLRKLRLRIQNEKDLHCA
jgi:hypothetical protein